MASVTISTRVEPDEARELEALAASMGFERSALVRSLLRRAMQDVSMEQAVKAYRNGKVSLSRAAERANVGLWDFIALMKDEDLKLQYDVEDFEKDLETLAENE